MNHVQVKRAKERIEEVYRTKRTALDNKRYSNGNINTLTSEVVFDQLKSGEATLRGSPMTEGKYGGSLYDSLSTYFVIPAFEERRNKIKEIEDKLTELHKIKERILDELILGDNKQALVLIQKLQEYEVN